MKEKIKRLLGLLIPIIVLGVIAFVLFSLSSGY